MTSRYKSDFHLQCWRVGTHLFFVVRVTRRARASSAKRLPCRVSRRYKVRSSFVVRVTCIQARAFTFSIQRFHPETASLQGFLRVRHERDFVQRSAIFRRSFRTVAGCGQRIQVANVAQGF